MHGLVGEWENNERVAKRAPGLSKCWSAATQMLVGRWQIWAAFKLDPEHPYARKTDLGARIPPQLVTHLHAHTGLGAHPAVGQGNGTV